MSKEVHNKNHGPAGMTIAEEGQVTTIDLLSFEILKKFWNLFKSPLKREVFEIRKFLQENHITFDRILILPNQISTSVSFKRILWSRLF